MIALLRRTLLILVNAGLAAAAVTLLAEPPAHPDAPARRASQPGPALAGEAASRSDKASADTAPPPADLFADPSPTIAQEAPPPALPALPPATSLVGTALGAGSFAVLRRPDGSIARLKQGDEVEGFRLEAIRRNAVILSAGGSRWHLAFPPAGPTLCDLSGCPNP
jgi:hypothetical protein